MEDSASVYVNFGRDQGCINNLWIMMYGAVAQGSDPRAENPDDYPTRHRLHDYAARIYNLVKLVRIVN